MIGNSIGDRESTRGNESGVSGVFGSIIEIECLKKKENVITLCYSGVVTAGLMFFCFTIDRLTMSAMLVEL